MQPLLRRGLLLVAASPLALTGGFFLARSTGASIFTSGAGGAFWGVVAVVAIAVLLLPLGATMCAVALMRAGRAGEPVVGPALIASMLVVSVTIWVRALLARGPSPTSTAAAPAPPPVVAVNPPHGGSGLLGVFLAVVVLVGAVVVMRRLRRLVE
jgi:hypothetical protein